MSGNRPHRESTDVADQSTPDISSRESAAALCCWWATDPIEFREIPDSPRAVTIVELCETRRFENSVKFVPIRLTPTSGRSAARGLAIAARGSWPNVLNGFRQFDRMAAAGITGGRCRL